MDNVMPAGVELPQLSPSGGYAAAAAEFDQTYGLDAAATVRVQPSWQGDSPVSAHCLRTIYTQPVPYSYNAGTGHFVTSSQHPSACIQPISAMGHYGAGPVRLIANTEPDQLTQNTVTEGTVGMQHQQPNTMVLPNVAEQNHTI